MAAKKRQTNNQAKLKKQLQSSLIKFLTKIKQHKINLWLVGILLLLSLRLFIPTNRVQNSRQNQLTYPYLVITHLNLAHDYYQAGYAHEAKKELEKINQSPFLSWQIQVVPGWQTKYEQTRKMVYEKDKIEAEIDKWEKWISSNPPSRDIYLKLSQLYWQLYDIDLAQKYASQAAYLDPTNPQIQNMEKLVTK